MEYNESVMLKTEVNVRLLWKQKWTFPVPWKTWFLW